MILNVKKEQWKDVYIKLKINVYRVNKENNHHFYGQSVFQILLLMIIVMPLNLPLVNPVVHNVKKAMQ